MSIAYLFPGQGSVARGSGYSYARPGAPLQRAAERVRARLGLDLSSVIPGRSPAPSGEGSNFLLEQVAICALSLGVAHALGQCGIGPAVLVGHSLGEIAALSAAGTFSVETATDVVVARSIAILENAPRGGMIAVQGDDQARDSLLAKADGVVCSTRNSPQQFTISGLNRDLAHAESVATQLGYPTRRLRAAFPFHSPHMARAAEAFAGHLRGMHLAGPSERVLSAIENRRYAPTDDLSELLSSHLVRPVDFVEACRGLPHEVTAAVEVGGGDALIKLLRACEPERALLTFATCRPGEVEEASLREAASILLQHRQRSPPLEATPQMTFSHYSNEELQAMAMQILHELGVRLRMSPGAWPSHAPAPPPGYFAGPPQPFAAPSFVPGPPPQPPPPFGRYAGPETSVRMPAPAPSPRSAGPSPQQGTSRVAAAPSRGPKEGGDGVDGVSGGTRSLEDGVVSAYQETTGYPLEVFDLDADLEADLGIDSVKQGKILALLQKRFNLPDRDDLVLAELNTLRKVVALVRGTAS